jgi:ABC-2 type transport system permease protein
MNSQEISTYDTNHSYNPFIEEFRELIRYRDLVTQLVARNIKTRYKRSVFGVLWTMINPLMMTGILALVFSNLFQAKESIVIYILTGLIVWGFFSQVTTHAMSELVWGGSLLNRIYIPKTVFAASALGTGLVNFGFSLVPLFIAMAIFKTPFKLALLFLPIAILLLAAFSLGLGLLLSNLSAGFTDVFEMYQIVITAWYFLTPILYPIEIIAPQKRWLFQLNPIYSILETFRAPILNGSLPTFKVVGMAAIFSTVSLASGWWYFTRKADQLPYKI